MLIDLGMYITDSQAGVSEYARLLVSLYVKERVERTISEKRNARTYRSRALTNFHACPREFSREFPRRKKREGVRLWANEASRARTDRRVGHTPLFTLPGPFDQHTRTNTHTRHTLSRSARSPFFPPVRWDARTRAHAPSTKTTHRRRS